MKGNPQHGHHSATVIQCAGCKRYRKQTERLGPCCCGGAFVRRAAIPLAERALGRRNRIPDADAAGILAAYGRGLSLSEVGRLFPWKGKARSYGAIREILVRRKVEIRKTAKSREFDRVTGRLLPGHRATDDEIRALVADLPRMMIPVSIRHEYLRYWPVARKRWLLGILRERFPSSMPRTVPSHGMLFDSCTSEAREICARLNVGRNSRNAVCKLDIRSEGILFEDTIWFWTEKVGYQSGPYRPGRPRALLHWCLWERANMAAVPAGFVVRHADGDVNNFQAANLVLVRRETLLRENQLGALERKSKGKLAALMRGGAAVALALKGNQRKTKGR